MEELDKKITNIAKKYYDLIDTIEDYLKGKVHNTKWADKRIERLLENLKDYNDIFEN